MKNKTKTRKLIINLMNSWPSENYYFYKGWILRFTRGVTYRANSVIPLNYHGNKNTIERDLNNIEKAYQKYSLPTVFMMFDHHKPIYLRKKLKKRNYKEFDHTLALGLPISDFKTIKFNENFEYSFQNQRTIDFSSFLAEFSSRDRKQQEIINKINERINISKKCFLIAKNQEMIVGTLMGVLDFDGYLYLADIFVKPNFRKQGIGTSLLYKIVREWALNAPLKMVWLQVEVKNKIALNLYQRIGFKKLYSYYYLSNF